MEREGARSLCPGCGLAVPGGAEGCQALAEELMAQGFSNPAYAGTYRLAWDTYCIQHPDRYCVSAKSFAAHFAGVCWGLEHGGRPEGYRKLNAWMDSIPPAARIPDLPGRRGAVTVADVLGAEDAESYSRAVERWARSAWEAYSDLQPLALHWIEEALKHR